MAIRLFDRMLPTSSNLNYDLPRWVKTNFPPFLHNGVTGSFYHKSCSQKELTEEEIKQFLDKHTIVYIETNNQRQYDLIAEILSNTQTPPCQCSIGDRVLDMSRVPFHASITIEGPEEEKKEDLIIDHAR